MDSLLINRIVINNSISRKLFILLSHCNCYYYCNTEYIVLHLMCLFWFRFDDQTELKRIRRNKKGQGLFSYAIANANSFSLSLIRFHRLTHTRSYGNNECVRDNAMLKRRAVAMIFNCLYESALGVSFWLALKFLGYDFGRRVFALRFSIQCSYVCSTLTQSSLRIEHVG